MAASVDVLEERVNNLNGQLSAAIGKIDELEAEVEGLEKDLQDQKLAQAAKEKKHLLAGIILLGSIVSTLGGVIWTYRGIIFK